MCAKHSWRRILLFLRLMRPGGRAFCKVDRPVDGIDLDEVIHGLTLFSHAYAGKIWLEILLVREMNDAPEDIEALIDGYQTDADRQNTTQYGCAPSGGGFCPTVEQGKAD